MAGYSVGNLKIAFDAVDQTSDDFKKLATNLRAIVKLINHISTADLGKFTANVKEITKAFNPFLTQIKDTTDGITALDNVIKQIGVKNLSSVVQYFSDLQAKAKKTKEESSNLPSIYQTASGAVDEFSNATNRAESEQIELGNAISKTTDVVNMSISAFSAYDVATKETSRLATAWKNLYASVPRFGSDDFGTKYAQQLNDTLNELGTQFLYNKQIVEEANQAFKRMGMSEEELVIEKYKDIQATHKQRIAYLEAELAMGASGKQARQYAKELAELRKQDGQVGKKSGFSKFLGQIKRIAIYRVIRAGLKAVTSAFKDGISALAQFDSGVNQTMSQLTTSFTIMKLSVSTALLPLLESITPIIQKISVGFANMANTISQAMSTTGYYTKINTDRLLAYNKAANLLDFDKFRSLTKGDDASTLLSTEKVDESEEKLNKVRNTIQGIKNIISGLWDTIKTGWDTIVKPILQILFPIIETSIQGIGKAVGEVGKFITKLNELGILKPLIYTVLAGLTAWGSAKVIGGIANLLKSLGNLKLGFIAVSAAITLAAAVWESWGDMNTWQRIISIIGVATTAVLGLAMAFGAFHSAWSLGAAVVGIVAGIGAVVASINSAKSSAGSNKVSYFANGGMPDKGSLFVAGESGAEFVYNMPSGQTGVTNVQQIRQAMYLGCLDALREYGAAQGVDMPQFREVSPTGLYEVVKGEMRRRGEKPAKV